MDHRLLAIQTQLPPAPPQLIRRGRLLDTIERALVESSVILIAAPAGSGKTMLLIDWAHQTSIPVAWLTIEESDVDPARFLRYFAMAWNVVDPTVLAAPAGTLLEHPQPDLDLAARALANHAILAGDPVAFVIDDLHRLRDPEALRLLTFLIDHMPLSFRFLLGSRGTPRLPLARFRVHHRLVQLDAKQLAFTLEESIAMLGNHVEPDAIARAHERTEGWAAGLRLLAQRDVAFNADSMLDIGAYIRDELLASFDPTSRAHLFAIGIVDQLTPALGDAILGASATAELLEQLVSEQLFVQPLDTAGNWYRLHPLLLDALRAAPQLHPAGGTLHARAARWFLEHDMIDDALEHAVAAGDPRLAVEIVEPRVVIVLVGGDFHRVERWIDLIPESWYLDQPELSFLRIAYLVFSGEFDRSLQLIDRYESVVGEPTTHARTLAKFQVARCAVACFQDRVPEAEIHAARAFEGLDRADVTLRNNTHHILADTYRRHGRWEDARRQYQETVTGLPGDPASALQTVHVSGALADLELRRGALRTAAGYWRAAIAAMRQQENWGKVPIPLTGWVYIRHGELLYEWNDLDGAGTALAHGLERAELGGDARSMIAGQLLAARIALARHDIDRSASALHRAEELNQRAVFPEWMSQVDRVRALLLVAMHDAANAHIWCRYADGPLGLQSRIDTDHAWLALAHLQIVFGGSAERERAQAVLERLLAEAQRDDRRMIAVEALALSALAADREGGRRAALDLLDRTLALAESEEPKRLLIDLGARFHQLLRYGAAAGTLSAYGQCLLDTCAVEISSSVGPGALLSDRELEVLRLVGAGLTNREIASHLFISTETVKRHLANIYDKLDVHRRIEALHRARSLGFIHS